VSSLECKKNESVHAYINNLLHLNTNHVSCITIKRMRYFLTLLLSVALISCKKPAHQNNEISKIELARGGGWSKGTAISIDSSLNYEFYGLLNKDAPEGKWKYYTGKITKAFWDTLNNKFEQINYKTLDTVQVGPIIEDANFFELIIHWGTQKRQIIRIDTDGTDAVSKTLTWLDSSFKKVNLHQVDTPFKFETIAQDPPRPKLKQIKFPPPITRKHFTK